MKHLIVFFLLMSFALQANSQKLLENLSERSEVTVVIFLAIDCPISQKYIPVLNAIHKTYSGRDVKIHAFVPGRIQKADLKKFEDEYGLAFTIAPDKKFRWVNMLSATTTPEVFVFDNQLAMKYRGAIDNWFYELGGYRKDATENYLIDSIEALLAGNTPEIEKTKPLGCIIQVPGGK